MSRELRDETYVESDAAQLPGDQNDDLSNQPINDPDD
jgi:hypothetical protein